METLRALPESHRQYVDHSHVIPYLWDELSETDWRARNASKVILQELVSIGLIFDHPRESRNETI